MLRFDGVSFGYPTDELNMMENLSFSVERGDFVAVIGASGCGKSTLFRLINGLEVADAGTITIEGEDVAKKKNFSAFMPQKDLLFPWRTIGKNVALPMEIMKAPKADQEKRVAEVLEQVGLSAYVDKYPNELSGGMKQRAAFARTLLSGAEMLLLDEPFSALDYLTRVEMQEWLLAQYNHFHKTILFITHDVEEAIFLAKDIYIITDERPFSHMEKIPVPLEYPRKREDLKRADVVELKETLIGKLRKGVVL